jgi:hypothetical protein
MITDIVIGLIAVILVGAWLDSRKTRWRGTPRVTKSKVSFFDPNYDRPSPTVLGSMLPPTKTPTVEIPLKVKL